MFRTDEWVDINIVFAPREQIHLLGERIQNAGADTAIANISPAGLPRDIFTAINNAVANNDYICIEPGPIAEHLIRDGFVRDDITANTIFAIPLEHLEVISEDTNVSFYLSGGAGIEKAAEIVQEMFRRHPDDIEYFALPMNGEIVWDIQMANDQARDFMMYAIIVLTAVFVGLIGYILMQWSQRRMEYALLSCLGVPSHVLFFESSMEITIPFLLSSMIGSGLSALFSSYISTGEVAVSLSPWSFILPIVAATCLVGILDVVNLQQMKRGNMSSMLRAQ